MNGPIFSILAVLHSCEGPFSSQEIAEDLSGQGIVDFSEGAVRWCHRELNNTGGITNLSKGGGITADKGRREPYPRPGPEPVQIEILITRLMQKKTAIQDGYWSVLKEL